MQSRRRALQTMAVSIGACTIPTLGLARPKQPRPLVMGLDQWESEWVFSWTDTTGDRRVDIRSIKDPVRYISWLFDKRGITYCAFDATVDKKVRSKIEELYPDYTITCHWWLLNKKKPIGTLSLRDYPKVSSSVREIHHGKEGPVLDAIHYYNRQNSNIALADPRYWVNSRHPYRVRYAVALEKIAFVLRKD